MIFRHRTVFVIAVAFFFLWPGTSAALVEGEISLGGSLPQVEREALDTLALADERMRDAVLEAALHPRSIDNIAIVQRQSSEAFRDRLANVPRTRQKDIWELVRYPALVDALVSGGRPSSGAIDQIVLRYPEDIQEIARAVVQNDFNLLNDIAHMRTDAEHETATVIASLPVSAQSNFEALIERPDLMSALSENPALVRHLGTLYREDPFATRARFDRYHDDLAAEKEQELAEWRDAIEEDPDAQAELIESAEEFAQEEGYESPRETTVVVERTEVHHYNHPYPYWFGTPYWHGGITWYPHRAHWGFGFDLGGAFFAFGVPSPFYYSWHDRHNHRRAKYHNLDRRLRHHRDRHHARHRSRNYRERGTRAGHNSLAHRKSDRKHSRNRFVRGDRKSDNRLERDGKRRRSARDSYTDSTRVRKSERKHTRKRGVKDDSRRSRKSRAREANRDDRRRRDARRSSGPRAKKRAREATTKVARLDRERRSTKNSRSKSSKKIRNKDRKSKSSFDSSRDRSSRKFRKKGKSTSRKRVAKRASRSSSKKKSGKVRSRKKNKKSKKGGGGGRNFARRK